MPSLAMTVPYMRLSPIHVPRRDLVFASADSLFLRVTIIDSDNSCAQAIEIGTGIGAPSAQFVVSVDQPGRYYYEYGWPTPVTGKILSNIAGMPSEAIGAFDFVFPSGIMSTWPRRCNWWVQLNYDSQGAEVLMMGSLHVRAGGMTFALAPPAIATDDVVLVQTDTEEQVLA